MTSTWKWSGNVQFGSSGQQVLSGTGSPEGVATGNVGDVYFRLDGGASDFIYNKTTGSGNTGWSLVTQGGGGGGGVSSLNTLTGDLNIIGNGLIVSPSGSNITISPTTVVVRKVARITDVVISGNEATITCVNDFQPGDSVDIGYISRMGAPVAATFLNGQTLTVNTATSTSFTADFTNADYGFTNLGAWDSGTAYVPYDVVTYGGYTWACWTGNTNHTPPSSSPYFGDDYWKVIYGQATQDTGSAGISYYVPVQTDNGKVFVFGDPIGDVTVRLDDSLLTAGWSITILHTAQHYRLILETKNYRSDSFGNTPPFIFFTGPLELVGPGNTGFNPGIQHIALDTFDSITVTYDGMNFTAIPNINGLGVALANFQINPGDVVGYGSEERYVETSFEPDILQFGVSCTSSGDNENNIFQTHGARWVAIGDQTNRGSIDGALNLAAPLTSTSGGVALARPGEYALGWAVWVDSGTNEVLVAIHPQYYGIKKSAGAPNGVEYANPGGLYVDSAGSVGTTLWVKESGTDTNTGWTPAFGILINPQTGSYQAHLTDANELVTITNTGAVNFTIPDNATVAFPVGTTLTVSQLGIGQVTLNPLNGNVTINTPSSLTTRAQYSTVSIVLLSIGATGPNPTVWLAGGDLT